MQRNIKSYVLRTGRISQRQQQSLEKYLNMYSLSAQEGTWDYAKVFGRQAQTILEIGFGMGASLIQMAKSQPNINFIGVEVHRPGIGSLLADIQENNLLNIRIANFDAIEVLEHHISDASLDGVQIFFPDPWPKKRHSKRRIMQNSFVQLLAHKIKPNGYIHCATDCEDYALHMLKVLTQEAAIKNQSPSNGFIPRPESRPITKFEKRGFALGHKSWDLLFVRQALLA